MIKVVNMKRKKNTEKFELNKLTVSKLGNNADILKGGTSLFGCVSVLVSCICTQNTIGHTMGRLSCVNCPEA